MWIYTFQKKYIKYDDIVSVRCILILLEQKNGNRKVNVKIIRLLTGVYKN